MLSLNTTMRMEEGDLEDGLIFVNYCWNDTTIYKRNPFRSIVCLMPNPLMFANSVGVLRFSQRC